MKILHMDIETFPNIVYAWGLFKQNVSINQIVKSGYTACWAAKWHGKAGVEYMGLNKHKKADMLQGIWDLLDEADAVCHYNGERFDIPTLNKEFIKEGLGVPSPYHQIDLLKVAKKQFRFASNKLDYVSQFLGLGAKTKHMGMDLWRGCMDGNDKDWKIMERYNKQDVRLLEKVYKRLLPWIKTHPNHALYTHTTRPVCTNCGSSHMQSRGTYTTKTQEYQRYHCQSCGTWNRERTTMLPKQKKSHVMTQC